MAQARDTALVRLLSVCAGRSADGVAALAAAQAAAQATVPSLPPELHLPAGVSEGSVTGVLAWFIGWAGATFGAIGNADPATWNPTRLEYAVQVTGSAPAGSG